MSGEVKKNGNKRGIWEKGRERGGNDERGMCKERGERYVFQKAYQS